MAEATQSSPPPPAQASAGQTAQKATPAPAHFGPPPPAHPPPANPEFQPNFQPPITHDLRAVRREMAHANELLPIEAGSATLDPKTALVTIPAVELHELRKSAALNILAVDFAKSDIPTDAALLLARTFREDLDQLAQKPAAPAVAQQVSAVRDTPINSAATPRPKRRFSLYAAGVLALVCACAYAASEMGRALERKRLAQEVSQAKINRRGYHPSIGGFNVAVFQAMQTVQTRVLWVTTDPMNVYFWELFGTVVQSGRQVQVVVVGDRGKAGAARELARIHNVDLYFSPVQIARCNLMQFDRTSQVDGSNDTVVYYTTDTQDIDKWTSAVWPTIVREATVVHRRGS